MFDHHSVNQWVSLYLEFLAYLILIFWFILRVIRQWDTQNLKNIFFLRWHTRTNHSHTWYLNLKMKLAIKKCVVSPRAPKWYTRTVVMLLILYMLMLPYSILFVWPSTNMVQCIYKNNYCKPTNVCEDNILRIQNNNMFAEVNVCVPCTKSQIIWCILDHYLYLRRLKFAF